MLLVIRGCYFFAPVKIADNGKEQECDKYPICFVIKEKAEEQ